MGVAEKKARPLVWLAWFVVLAALTWFVVKNVPQYLVLTADSYGGYFWPKVRWLFPHVTCGLLAVVLGPLQFWPRMRRDYLPYHRIAGRVYVVTVLVGAVASTGMSLQVTGAPTYALGLFGLAVAWITTTSMAFVAIRRKNMVQHKQWMVRSYVVTFAFVTFRLGDDLLKAGNLLNNDERSSLLAWSCWAVPLLIAEVALQAGAVFKQRA
jgi:uncharacterized membrane protein